ncbi:Multiprotein-bridging factor 1c [Nymphaea thermarum]|nr:Multiprotein-bridging factor 1c [Nymphaea thermarum]
MVLEWVPSAQPFAPGISSVRTPSRYAGNISQDWEPVVLDKTKPKSGDLHDPKAVNAALRVTMLSNP